MLTRTFLHCQGVTLTREKRLWDQGAVSWDACLSLVVQGRLPGYTSLFGELVASRKAKADGKVKFFAKRLPPREHWRLLGAFEDQIGFLDIETTGLSPVRDHITIIGLQTGGRFQTFIRGVNLEAFPEAAREVPILVTFNGSCFDLPFLVETFPSYTPDVHVDLRYPLARLQMRGGLKAIERKLGLARPSEVAGMDGMEAVWLWYRYLAGDRHSLSRLLTYLEADVAGLVPLARYVSRHMPARCGAPGPPAEAKVEETLSGIVTSSRNSHARGGEPKSGYPARHLPQPSPRTWG